jgi:hypothetical protein
MSSKKPRSIVPGGGILHDITNRIKLVIRLVGDSRVNALYKVLPLASLAYLIIPDLAIGPFDDAAIIWVGTYLFVELCDPEVVKEHAEALRRVIPVEWREGSAGEASMADTVDAEYRETPFPGGASSGNVAQLDRREDPAGQSNVYR